MFIRKKALNKYSIILSIIQSRISELSSEDILLQEKWNIEKSLKEETKEIMKSCDIFKNIHRIRSKKQRTKIKKKMILFKKIHSVQK
jgi:ribosomal protein S26